MCIRAAAAPPFVLYWQHMPGRAIQALSFRLLATATAGAAGLSFAPAAFAGAADNVTGWAWSGSLGWISMNCTNQASCATADYGVRIDETPGFGDRGDLNGWAWSETLGWICFGITCAGTTPEGGAPYAQYRANFNGKQDQFWGWAQVLNMGTDGWIALNCDKAVGPDDCGPSPHYVVLNNVDGNFTQLAANDHWAWGNTNVGIGIGWVDFSTVNTSWTLARLGVILRPRGVYEPNTAISAFVCATVADCSTHAPYLQCDATAGKCMLPGTHLPQFAIKFPTMSGALNQLLECEVRLPDSSQRILNKVFTTAVRNGVPATSLTYELQGSDAVQQNAIWYINACRIAGSAFGAACANDAACGAGKICDESAGRCRDIIEESNKRRPIYTHGTAWTGLDAAQDQYLAIKCNAGFPNNYFKNAAKCDFTGDASFALAMRRGIPVEGNCGDLIDNDGNGQTDCADRYCKGISYVCQTLARTRCVWSNAGDGIIDCSDPAYQTGELCCTRLDVPASNPVRQHIVDGLECDHGDANDGYYDCDDPGYPAGDLCCTVDDEVTKL